MPTNINADALPELESLAAWVSQSAEMKEEKGKKNLLGCVDKDREAKARPLLEKLGYATMQGHFALLLRICGKASIEKLDEDNRTLLFFPLSGDVQVAGEVLKPGTYIPLVKTLDLDAQLDCLIIVLP
ncbi:hypothetical protein N7471_013003 [Penicillium samsonianum]|uniref:uncharacterized protein n=1 Tax=Penicillium samsonianum TaxID=1882272 RepID=UPI00254835FF|nr:uncharacterized protein N7471_013003 [Penicillium samsonianum]KAJ6119052.1 hypothetical protein N7471_013003 [Penicillium samsonianum]